jgi:hypothetical protein
MIPFKDKIDLRAGVVETNQVMIRCFNFIDKPFEFGFRFRIRRIAMS